MGLKKMTNTIIKTILLIFTGVFLISCGEKKVSITAGEMTNGELLIFTLGNNEPLTLRSGETLKVTSGPITIEARGDKGYDFNYWNDFDDETKQIFISVKEDLNVSATFANKTYMVSLDKSLNGAVTVSPKIEIGKSYPANTIFTISGKANPGYEIDSLYYAVPGPWWVNYFESTEDNFKVRLSSDMVIGGSFINSELINGIKVFNDVVYAKPGVKKLKYDIFAPDEAKNLPLFIIVHGGGWSSNSEDVMRGMAREIATTGKYVVASIDYRWIANVDGDPTKNMLHDLIGDVYGAIAHVVENANVYGADPTKIVITGDSAGGHLSAAAATMIERIGDGGFGEKQGVYEINPTYLPKGMSAKKFKEFMMDSVKAVAPSYGVFDVSSRIGVSLPELSGEALKALSPIFNIPTKSERAIPHFLVRGTVDPLINNETVQNYTYALQEAGQEAIYLEVLGAGHAFYDWKPDPTTQDTFYMYGVPYIHKMLDFFNNYL